MLADFAMVYSREVDASDHVQAVNNVFNKAQDDPFTFGSTEYPVKISIRGSSKYIYYSYSRFLKGHHMAGAVYS